MLPTAADAYKIMQLQGQKLPALVAFHMITRGNALALGLENEIAQIPVQLIGNLGETLSFPLLYGTYK